MKSKVIIFFSILAIIIIAGAVIQKFSTLQTTETACTEEALMCPDGSAVGRSGPECVFSACTNPGSFTGQLAQSPDGAYYLHMKSVLPEAKEPYIMPLDFAAANALGYADIVGQEVTVSGSFINGNTLLTTVYMPTSTLTGNTPATNPGSNTSNGGRVMAPKDIPLKVGETGDGLGLEITLKSVTNDSRCPPAVQCIQAGSVTTLIALATDSTAKTVTYVSNAEPLVYEGYKISIVDVTPAARSGVPMKSSDYTVTFHVESALTGIVDNPNASVTHSKTSATDCKKQGGTWDEIHRECGGIDATKCTAIGGEFNECGSACRHNPNAEMCTMQCVQFCQL